MSKQIQLSEINPSTLLVGDAIDKLIGSIKTRGKRLDIDIHLAACSALEHTRVHGDWTKLQKLLLASPRSARGKALAFWIVAHGAISAIDAKTKKVTLKKGWSGSSEWKVEEACATPFWDFTEEKNPEPLNKAGLLKYLATAAKGGTASRPVTKEAALAALDAYELLGGEFEDMDIEELRGYYRAEIEKQGMLDSIPATH